MKSILFSFVMISCSMAAQVEQVYPDGLVFEDEAYESLPRQAAEDGSKADLPEVVDLTPYCPEIRHQGYIFSCVGWAVGYGAMSIQRAVMNRCTDKNLIGKNAHSALFLYNQVKAENCDKGARISDALHFLGTNGDCLARQFDFDINNCVTLPDSNVSKIAKRFVVSDFVTLFSAKALPEHKILRIKKVLANEKPVVVGMSLLRNFYELKNAIYWHPALGNTAPAGGHAMVVVGYDDKKAAFRLMNSWGKSWGDQGFIWIKYSDFSDYCKYAYCLYFAAPSTMADTEETNINVPEKALTELSGHFSFRAFAGWSQHSAQPLFETADFTLNENIYTLKRKDWPIGQLFQMVVNAVQFDQYLYVFSVDSEKNIHFHWPRQAGLNEKFVANNESALLTAGNAEITIPGPTKCLTLEKKGTDRLVAIFSKQKIETISKLANIAVQKPGNFNQNLIQTLGKYAVPATDITYFPNTIGFEAKTRSAAYIVPLILEVETQ